MNVFKTKKGRDLVYQSYDKILELWNIDFKEQDVETSYGKTHVLIAGNKENPPLLLFHGAGDNAAMMWGSNIQTLSKKFYCIAVDTLGSSGKSIPDDRYGKSFLLAKWFCDILDALKINKTHLTGVSYGCELSQHFLITCPDRVIKIVGIVGRPIVKGYKYGRLKRAISVFFPQALFPTRKNVDKILFKLIGPDTSVNDIHEDLKTHLQLLIKHFNPMSQRFHNRKVFLPEQLEQVKDRVLFLVGDSDRLSFSPEVLRAFIDMNLNYTIFKNAGHLLNGEKPEEINNAIISFLS